MPVNLKKLVDTKIAQKKITPDDAREVLAAVREDKKFSATEIKQLQRLAALPAARFVKKDEFIPNPMDSEDGVTITADPKRWIQSEIQLATAKLAVHSSIPELELSLSKVKTFDDEDFGDHQARTLDVTSHGKAASRDGTIDFTYGSKHISLDVKKGATLESIANRLQSQLLKKEGAMSVSGSIDANKSGKQTIKFEVL